MTGFRRWLSGRTLRARLIAGLLTLLAVACAAIGIVTYTVLSTTLISQTDAQLAAAGGRFASCIETNEQIEHDGVDQGDHNPSPRARQEQNCSIGQAWGTFGARIKRGVVTTQAIVGGKSRLTAADKKQLLRLPPNGRPYTRDLTSLRGDYRLMATTGQDHDILVTGLPLAHVESTLRNVELAEIVVFAAALVLTGVIGTGWVRLSLRPLRRVAATATRVTQLPLASGQVTLPERVPDTDPRTEVGQVGTAFNRMLGHVESALARRAASEARLRRFAADASHELRTPLAAIRGYAELTRRHPGPVPADIAHALGRVEAESARMSVLVDELLLLAQLDAGRPLAAEPVDLTRLALDATSDARVATPDHRWQLVLPDEPVVVEGDQHRLQQVMANLMSNAARHTPSGTTVTVELAPATEPGQVRLSVTDNGPGIPAELQPSLFERFVRGDSSRSRAAGSTGLGLAIVDAVIAAHGGKVSVTSRPGHSRFEITLPRRSPDSGPADGSQAARPAPPAGPATEPGRPPQAAGGRREL
ncbi:MAG: HAMP domain-containing histidine kinase [Nocardiopsaceae bacterium]|jgi:two-component system OmpR family sensor kinase|nr:HAMP domain-containing histidine kinase [Nocardiopsaceae bacterium]